MHMYLSMAVRGQTPQRRRMLESGDVMMARRISVDTVMDYCHPWLFIWMNCSSVPSYHEQRTGANHSVNWVDAVGDEWSQRSRQDLLTMVQFSIQVSVHYVWSVAGTAERLHGNKNPQPEVSQSGTNNDALSYGTTAPIMLWGM